jgi:transcriptional regulator with XRE-family HTH domain
MIEPHGLSATDAAAKLHVTREAMSNLLCGRSGLSAEMAIRFEKAFGLNADTDAGRAWFGGRQGTGRVDCGGAGGGLIG